MISSSFQLGNLLKYTEKRVSMYKDKELAIRKIKAEDLPRLWELIYKKEAPEWKKWDAPYFPHQSMPFYEFMEAIAPKWIGCADFWVITAQDTVCGTVSYYFEDEQEK